MATGHETTSEQQHEPTWKTAETVQNRATRRVHATRQRTRLSTTRVYSADRTAVRVPLSASSRFPPGQPVGEVTPLIARWTRTVPLAAGADDYGSITPKLLDRDSAPYARASALRLRFFRNLENRETFIYALHIDVKNNMSVAVNHDTTTKRSLPSNSVVCRF